MADKPLGWLLEWLGQNGENKPQPYEQSSSDYNPQPYEQLSKVLRRYGYHDKADRIMIAANDRRLKEGSMDVFTCFSLWVQKLTIKYGYANENALFALFLFLVIGAGLGTNWKGNQVTIAAKLYDGLEYSFQELVPFPGRGERTKGPISREQAGLYANAVRGYFWLHRIGGFLLASLFVAGMTGLTK